MKRGEKAVRGVALVLTLGAYVLAQPPPQQQPPAAGQPPAQTAPPQGRGQGGPALKFMGEPRFPRDAEEFDRETRIVGAVGLGPGVLVEGLNHVIGLGERLPQAKGKDALAVGQMAENRGAAPFVRRRTSFQSVRSQTFGMRRKFGGRLRDHRARIASPQK